MIPVTELEKVSDLNYTFDSISTEDSHFYYDPDANDPNTLATASETGVFEYVSDYDDDDVSTNSSSGWYLRV
ncbi:MAG: hypothetical protein LUC50_07425 [Ruminococcus sp.]|nr:hypothetical protein [Ruminococcus sp.]